MMKKEIFTYSGAFSPPLSSCSSDVESLSWDNYDYYKHYYENDAEYEESGDKDDVERKCEDDDHGPIQSSTSSHDESSKDEESAVHSSQTSSAARHAAQHNSSKHLLVSSVINNM